MTRAEDKLPLCAYLLAERDRLAAFTILAPVCFLQGRALVAHDQVWLDALPHSIFWLAASV